MSKLTMAKVIAPMGVRLDAGTRVLLSADMLRRFSDSLECNDKGKPKKVRGAYIVESPITLKKGLEVEIDVDKLSRREQASFDWPGRNGKSPDEAESHDDIDDDAGDEDDNADSDTGELDLDPDDPTGEQAAA